VPQSFHVLGRDVARAVAALNDGGDPSGAPVRQRFRGLDFWRQKSYKRQIHHIAWQLGLGLWFGAVRSGLQSD